MIQMTKNELIEKLNEIEEDYEIITEINDFIDEVEIVVIGDKKIIEIR